MYNQSHKYDLGTYNFFLHDLAQIFPRENALRFDKWQYCVHNSVFFSVYFSKIYHVTFLKVVPTSDQPHTSFWRVVQTPTEI